jgi:hypothetical protein
MYKIIGSDAKEYGPVGADELRQWIQEGRANAQSRIRTVDATEWRPLSTFPEFAAALSAVPMAPPPPLSPAPITVMHRPAQKTNGMAITGFVCSLLGIPCCFTGLFGVLGLIFSLIGLSQIKHNPQYTGKGMAIAGVIISIVLLLCSAAFWLMALFGAFQNMDPSIFK